MAKKTYSEKLKDPRWQKMRLKVMNRDKFRCKLCKDDTTTLNVHHLSYEGGCEPWEYPLSNFETLCEHCHSEVEILKEDTAFSDIKILKVIGWSFGGRLIMISAKEEMSFKFLDKDGNTALNIGLDTETMESMKIFITKHLKENGKKINGHSEVEQAVPEELGSTL